MHKVDLFVALGADLERSVLTNHDWNKNTVRFEDVAPIFFSEALNGKLLHSSWGCRLWLVVFLLDSYLNSFGFFFLTSLILGLGSLRGPIFVLFFSSEFRCSDLKIFIIACIHSYLVLLIFRIHKRAV